MTEIEIGRHKRARHAYGLDDVSVVPSRRTRDPEDVSLDWTIDAFSFSIPVVAAPHGLCDVTGNCHRPRPPGGPWGVEP